MTEKRQTSQGYIIRVLQHFATKLRNITNFVMLFQVEVKFLSRLVEIKILVIREYKVHKIYLKRQTKPKVDLGKKNEIHYHCWNGHLKMSKIAMFGC